MIESQFYIDEHNYPVFSTNAEYYMLWELGSFEKEYVDTIVSELERIKKASPTVIILAMSGMVLIAISKYVK